MAVPLMLMNLMCQLLRCRDAAAVALMRALAAGPRAHFSKCHTCSHRPRPQPCGLTARVEFVWLLDTIAAYNLLCNNVPVCAVRQRRAIRLCRLSPTAAQRRASACSRNGRWRHAPAVVPAEQHLLDSIRVFHQQQQHDHNPTHASHASLANPAQLPCQFLW